MIKEFTRKYINFNSLCEWEIRKEAYMQNGYGVDTWQAFKLEYEWIKLKRLLYIDGKFNELAHREWLKTIDDLLLRLFNLKSLKGDTDDWENWDGYHAFYRRLNIERKRISDRLFGKFFKMSNEDQYTGPDKWDNGYVK